MDNEIAVGARLKHARLNFRLSLRQLADKVGCTESYLSKVENNKVRPSLPMLHKIAVTLGISVAKLFVEEDHTQGPVTILREGERAVLRTDHRRAGDAVSLETLLPSHLATLLEANIHHVPAGASSQGFLEHQGEEMGFVLEGELELTVGEQTVRVGPGDSFFFLSHIAHAYRNIGSTDARVLWVNTPQSF
ncbi:MAG TPA: cupin domain-containing protein [Paraburkholderia sp.]|uniref:cupin domain-containing protein n=1 Tax=Paraburkholderia sp. TaxID=1926495 RepID=UPI002C826ECB|nr:cupin domain-containing protein [Paraburkholderia sp.]HTR08191.1 cupin domain-containing protein [Paraburkholderia sp.]